MKKSRKCIYAFMTLSLMLLGCGEKRKIDTSKTQYEQDKDANEAQIIANKGSDGTKYGGAAAGAGIGAAGGAAAGAGTGAAIGAGVGSIVPGAGTAIGAGTGAIIGAIVGGIGGLIGGGVTGYELSNGDMSEYINATTNFVFTQHDGSPVQTMIYGATTGESNYFDPIFTVGEDASLIIEMNTSLLNKAKKQVLDREARTY